jgi:DNA-binding transcriptional MerR regulator
MCYTEEEFLRQIMTKIQPILSLFPSIFVEVGYDISEIEEIMNELKSRTEDAVDNVLLKLQDRKKRLLSDIKSLNTEINFVLNLLKQPISINVCSCILIKLYFIHIIHLILICCNL